MGKKAKSTRNRFSKAVRTQFVEGFIKQPLNPTKYLKSLNSNGHNVNKITYGVANRWLVSENVPTRSTKRSPLFQADRFGVVQQYLDLSLCS